MYGYQDIDDPRKADAAIGRMTRKSLVQKTGKGKSASFEITDSGKKLVSFSSPRQGWDAPWDGHWRVVVFDLAAHRTKDRQALWLALRSRKLGLLQRSVWIWPHEFEDSLKEITNARGIPECFCGFESRRLFLCTDQEVVRSAWKFDRITEAHKIYLRQKRSFAKEIPKASNTTNLVRLAWEERRAYQEGFLEDPILPTTLCPEGYLGYEVEEAHREIAQRVRERFRQCR